MVRHAAANSVMARRQRGRFILPLPLGPSGGRETVSAAKWRSAQAGLVWPDAKFPVRYIGREKREFCFLLNVESGKGPKPRRPLVGSNALGAG